MRSDVLQYIRSKPELHKYLRYKPYWYRKLGRDPGLISVMEKEAKYFFGKTFPQRMDRLNNNMNMAMMFLEMMRGFAAPK
ncbi:YlbE-like family protein [Evansella sp. LMS18]|jgi:hypothetical protein|uniref:YlbE-like family protein n=1 Tax=Evansella sp. LMS18 TaxID=2924033 RepID=UPI0020D14513|nr:YlbE-like family protein [Evansella sp. LMS18]UTR10995.1 YlbE-like family protein [Evansella sp. LMS18]